MDTATLLLELGTVLLVLAVAARLSVRTGISPIPLYLAAGLALGDGGLLPVVTAQDFIEAAAEIGVVLLLFMLGLEYSADELASSLRTIVRPAAVDLVANATPGLVAGLLLGWGLPAAVVLAGVTYISSSGIAAKLIDDLGWLANRETPVVLTLLVAEDLVMAVYLPVLVALLAGGTTAVLAGSVALSLGAAGAALIVAIRFGPALSRLVLSRSNEAMLLGVLGVTLMGAGLAERVHISAAVGAFLVGIAFAGPVQDRARGLLQPLRDLFAAAFFVLFGLTVSPRSIPAVLPVAVTLAIVTGATKYASSWWATRQAGIGGPGRRRAAAALLSRGEFSIVIAEIGVAAGLHDQLGPVATAYILILGIAGPIVARLERRGATTAG